MTAEKDRVEAVMAMVYELRRGSMHPANRDAAEAEIRQALRDQQAEIERLRGEKDAQAKLKWEAYDANKVLLARAEQAEAEVGRLKADWGRLIHKDEAAAVCRSGVEICFEYGDTVRCGPCGIDLAKLAGVEPDMTKPQLPEVSRLKREVATLTAQLSQARGALEECHTLMDTFKFDSDEDVFRLLDKIGNVLARQALS